MSVEPPPSLKMGDPLCCEAFGDVDHLKGKDIFDENEKLKKKTERFAHEKFEKFMHRDRIPEDSKRLIIEAYEEVLLKHRRVEKDMLNRRKKWKRKKKMRN